MLAHSDSYDVLVVGAGPAGLTTAAGLARTGIRVLVVEKHPGTSLFPKASGVRPRTMEIFRVWDLEQRIRAGAQDVRLEQAKSSTLAGPPVEVSSLGVPDPKVLAPVTPAGFAFCPQDRLEPVLLDSVRGHGGHVRFNTELIGFQLDADGVRARLRPRHRTDSTYSTHARYLVGADGPRSVVRTALGIDVEHLGTEGDHLATLFFADLDTVLPDPPFALHEVTAPGAEGLFVNAGRHRWVYDRQWRPKQGEDLSAQTRARVAQRLRAAAGLPLPDLKIAGLFPWTMGAEVASSYRVGPAFLVGDAAARTTPRGALGMNTGIAAAHNLAWKLSWVLRGWAGEALLDSYDEERRPVGAGNARQSLEIQQEDAREPGVEDFGVRYASTAVIGDDGAPTTAGPVGQVTTPGMRAPHAWIERDGRRMSTLDLFEGQLTLLVGRRGAPWTAALASLARTGAPFGAFQIGAGLADPHGSLSRLYGIGEHGAALIRPDGHVAWHTASTHPRARAVLAGVIERVTGQASSAVLTATGAA